MSKLLPFLYLFLLPLFSFSQKSDYIWFTGYSSDNTDPNFGGTVIDFNEEPPNIYAQDRDMNIASTIATFSNENGMLFSYTNGIYMANSIHELMQNGDSLNPGIIADQNNYYGYRAAMSEFYLKDLNNPDLLHLFHQKLDYHPTVSVARTTLYQTTIDITQNNGLGAVIDKNKEIMTDGTFSPLTAVKHGNGRDWWIFQPQIFQNNYYRILFSKQGLSEIDTLELLPNFPSSVSSNGISVFSPDGSKLVRFEIAHGVYIFDFDRCSGELSNQIFVPLANTTLGAGVSISPNSRFVYCFSQQDVYQFDLWADDIEDSKVLVAEYDGYQSPFASTFFLSQLGPDGRIYANCTNSENVLHAIQYPNKQGLACEVRQHSVQLPTYNAFTMPHFPNYRLGPLDGSPCDTLGLDNLPLAGFRYESDSLNNFLVEFTDNSFYEPTDWLWNFADNGATSTEKDPLHEFSGSGVYEVCLTVSNQYASDTYCREVELILDDATEVVGQEFEVTVYPNPIHEEFTVFSSAYLQKAANLVFYNQLGQEVATFELQKGQQVHNFTVNDWAEGIYFYVVQQNGMQIGKGKIIISK